MTNRDIDRIQAWLFNQDWFRVMPPEAQVVFGSLHSLLVMYDSFQELSFCVTNRREDEVSERGFMEFLGGLQAAFHAGWMNGQVREQNKRKEQ